MSQDQRSVLGHIDNILRMRFFVSHHVSHAVRPASDNCPGMFKITITTLNSPARSFTLIETTSMEQQSAEN